MVSIGIITFPSEKLALPTLTFALPKFTFALPKLTGALPKLTWFWGSFRKRSWPALGPVLAALGPLFPGGPRAPGASGKELRETIWVLVLISDARSWKKLRNI